jgi:ABC-type lipoprotein release transport system permease subunit
MAYGLARLVANLLRGVRPDDPMVFVSIAVTIVATALLASWVPARRASRINPMAALRDE